MQSKTLDDDVRDHFTHIYFFLYEYNRVINFEGQLFLIEINRYVKKMFPLRILQINNDKVFTVI